MSIKPTIKITGAGSEAAAASLQHGPGAQEQNGSEEHPDLVHKRAINNLTGASIRVPPEALIEEKDAIKPLETDAAIQKMAAKKARPD